MFKKFLTVLCLIAALSLLSNCAGQTAQQTTGTTMLAMHDLVKTSAESANALCIQKIIPADKCAKIKVVYDKFRQSWAVADDALIVYLKASPNDSAAATAFAIANTLFTQDYAQIIALLTDVGLLKGGN